MTQPTQRQRIALFDILRALALINMVAYHAMYDLVHIFCVDAPWFESQGAFLWQQSICWTFILVSGAVFSFSRHPVRHGIVLFGCGMVLTVVTLTVLPQEQILFGILHFLGCAALITALLQQMLVRINPIVGALGSFLLFAVFYLFPVGMLGVFRLGLVHLPEVWYASPYFFAIGLMPSEGFYSSDYFSIIPWLFLYWTGFFAWRACKNTSVHTLLAKIPACKPLARLSSVSLWVYMVHQPIIYGVCLWIFRE